MSKPHVVIAGAGLALLMGYAGQISLGQGGFYALGAYGVGILTVKYSAPLGLAVIGTLAGTTALAYLVGWPVLRLRGHHLAMATLALAIIVHTLLINLRDLTGGAIGLAGIPILHVGDRALTRQELYWLCWGVAFLVLLFVRNVVRSRPGRALQALASEEAGAESLGVPVFTYRLHVFALSALLGAGAGVLYVLSFRFLSPDAFTVQLSVFLLVVVAVGGLRDPYGALIGAVVVQVLTTWLQDLGTTPGLPDRLPVVLNTIVYGSAIILIMRFMPDGLVPEIGRLLRWGAGLLSSSPGRRPGKAEAVPDQEA
jgi:branched-chain amino acid transport system permease protein